MNKSFVFEPSNKVAQLEINGGVVEMLNNKLMILAD